MALRPDTYQPPTYGERSEQHTEPPHNLTTLQPYNLTCVKRAKEKGGALVDSALGQNMAITSHRITKITGAIRMARTISRMSSLQEKPGPLRVRVRFTGCPAG